MTILEDFVWRGDNDMKNILTVILMMGSMVFTQSGVRIVGGITYSTISGDDFSEALVEDASIDVNNKSIMGLRFGAEKTMENGLIAGATYSNRGGSFSSRISFLFKIFFRISKLTIASMLK